MFGRRIVVRGSSMTEAMSRREIEDVLTSIKRLVSQDVPARQSANRDAAMPADGCPDTRSVLQRDKLLLTAELRVPEADARPDACLNVELAEPLTTPAPAPAHAPRGDDAGSPDTAAPAPDTLASAPITTILPAPAVEQGNRPSLIRRIASAGGPPDFMAASHPVAPPAQATTHDVPPQAKPDESSRNASDDTASRPETHDLEEAALEATLARLEAALSGTATQPTPSQTAFGAKPAEDSAWTEQVIDEAMLYQLVAQIVRQELQGELGEKITRNIRKLVRQEVARELQLRRDQSSFSG